MSVSRLLNRLLGSFLAIGLILSPLSAGADLNWQLYEFNDMTGGLNDSASALNIADNEASSLQDVIFPRINNGSVSTRPGYTQLNSSAIAATPACTGVTFFKLINGTRYLVSVWTDNKIRSMAYTAGTGPNGTFTDITGTTVFSTTQDTQASFSVAENTLVGVDGLGTNPPVKWSGTGNVVTLGGSPPNAKFCAYHNKIMFLAGDTANPSTLTFSNLTDINTWTNTDTIKVETNSYDGIIRGLKTGLDGLYIWKDSSIWRLSGTNRDNFVLERMVQGTGTLSNSSISVVNSPRDTQQLFVFVTQNGDVAVYDGGINVRIVSHKIINSFPNSLSFSRVQYAVSTNYEFLYMVSVSASGSGTHNRIFVFDLLHQAWTVFTGMAANTISTYEKDSGQQAMTFGDYSGRLNAWDITDTTTLNDPSSTAINSFYLTGWRSFSDAGVEKVVRVLRVFANQEGAGKVLDTEVRGDFEATGTQSSLSLAGKGSLWDTAVWDTDKYGDLSVTIQRIEPDKGYNTFLVKFSNGNRVSERFRVRKFQLLVQPQQRV